MLVLDDVPGQVSSTDYLQTTYLSFFFFLQNLQVLWTSSTLL